MIEVRASEGIGLREIARIIGVSPTAVYGHFPGKEALLQALASEGFRQLADTRRDAWEERGAGEAGFTATGVAYVQFAVAKPGLFRLMFGHGPYRHPDEQDSEAERSMALLWHHAALATGLNVDSIELEVFALRAWCLVHGLSNLILEGRIREDEIEAAIRRTVKMFDYKP